MPDSGNDIFIPVIVPNQSLTISYLYFPPITYDKVNIGVKFDEGFAIHIPVLLQRQYPVWIHYIAVIIMLVGMLTILYGLIEIVALILAAILR